MRIRTDIGLLCTTGLMLIAGQNAYAQADNEAPAAQEIIVTAQKRAQSLQDIPLSVDVVSSDALQSRQTDTMTKLATVVPSFEFARAPSDIPGITFRGIGTQAGNVAFDNSIGMFVDGAFMGNVRLYGQTLFDTARVELIKGTQSTLLGKNTSLGALSVVNNQPKDEFGGRIELGGELQNGGYMADGAINVPVSDVLSLRVAGRYVHDDGWVQNVTTNRHVPQDTNWGIRAIARFQMNDATEILLSYQHTDNKRIGSATQMTDPGLSGLGLGAGPALGESDFDDTKASYSSSPELHDGDDYYRTKVDLPILTMNVDMGAATLTSITSAAWFKNINNADFDFDNKDANLFLRSEDYEQYSQELRIASDGKNRIDYIAGVYYFSSKWNQVQRNIYGIPDFPPDPTSPLYGQLFNGSYTNTFSQKTDAYSVFGQLSWKPTDALTVNVGGRYTHERKRVHFGREAVGPLTLWNTVISAPFPYQALKPAKDDLLSGSLSVQYELRKNTMVYASVSRGGKAGGYGEFNTIPLDPVLGTGNPQRDAVVGNERATAWELGVKGDFFDRLLTLNIAGFWTDVYGLQQLVFTSDGLFVSSNDRARSRGVEGSYTLRLSPALTLSGSATYADANQLRPKLRLAQSPRFSASSRIDWNGALTDTLDLSMGAAVKYRSGKYNQLGEALWTGSYTTLALNARLESASGWFLNASAENVTNAKGADFGFPGPDPFVGTFETMAPLRTIRVSVGMNF